MRDGAHSHAPTHGWVGDEELPAGSSEVTVKLEPRDGGTRVVICHRGIPEGTAGGMQEGWDDFAEITVKDAVAHARESGYSWAFIGSLIGTSSEAARQRYGHRQRA